MSIEKISGINTTYANTRASPKRQPSLPEKTENISTGKTEGAKNVAKIKDPPFFPIGDTWSIFDIKE